MAPSPAGERDEVEGCSAPERAREREKRRRGRRNCVIRRSLSIPWQFGVDYDTIGRSSAHELFDEQLDVRQLLRAQAQTKWTVVSTGMITSFLFDSAFGVVDALADIGKFTAEIVLGDDGSLGANWPVFIGGDTLSYARVAELVEKITERSAVTVPEALERLKKELDNVLWKFYAVSGAGKGVAWDLEETWNSRKGVHALTAEGWARENL
ncbi:isoflavone reductase [Histoplasma capsulatum var. duboisii H88]|uniref:Isoflavone reductase n=1 Tax=Ajellomyces capsulatus (strain H88) TaxID=544711 RepID=F0UE85_AJEC8|nr:isoflavone reductase [Histoplasma capsulatum var. duboisii H88]